MVRKRNNQPSTCPGGWLKAGIRVPVHLTGRQEKYAARCVGIARAVYNQMVATHHLSRVQGHGPWPSPMQLERTFNELKRQPDFGMAYATQVSKFVAQGACRDFRRAYENWRNPDLRAARPSFKKKNRNGTGSFLAASGVDRVRYGGHRRIKLPYLGSVKLKRDLPVGRPCEARIRRQDGRWYASINYWKPPVAAEDKTHIFGGVDVGLTPLAVDSELVHYENPQPLARHLRQLRRWQRASDRRTPGSCGWREAQCRISAVHRRITGLREDAHHRLSPAGPQVRRAGHREPECGRYGQTGPSGPFHQGRRHRRAAAEAPLQGGVVRHPDSGSRPVVSPQQAVLPLRPSPCGTSAGGPLELPAVRHRARPQRERRAQPGGPGAQGS